VEVKCLKGLEVDAHYRGIDEVEDGLKEYWDGNECDVFETVFGLAFEMNQRCFSEKIVVIYDLALKSKKGCVRVFVGC